MQSFFVQYGLEIIFGIIATITSVIAIYYAKEALIVQRRDVIIDPRRTVQIYLSRESMIAGLAKMYDTAEAGDVIWFQTVGMQNYPGKVHEKILFAASKNVAYKMILNSNSPAVSQFIELFEPVKNANYVLATTNRLRIQGLSDKEIIIGFPSLTAYTAIRFTDKAFIEIVKTWFDKRFDELSRTSGAKRNDKQTRPSKSN